MNNMNNEGEENISEFLVFVGTFLTLFFLSP